MPTMADSKEYILTFQILEINCSTISKFANTAKSFNGPFYYKINQHSP